jgi:hypothetical protein
MFTFDALAARLNFKRLRIEGEEDGATATDGVATGDASKSAPATSTPAT